MNQEDAIFLLEHPSKDKLTRDEWNSYWSRHFSSIENNILTYASIKCNILRVRTPNGSFSMPFNLEDALVVKDVCKDEYPFMQYNFEWKVVDKDCFLLISGKSQSDHINGFPEWNELISSQNNDIRRKCYHNDDWDFTGHTIFSEDLEDREIPESHYDAGDRPELRSEDIDFLSQF